MLVGWPWSLLTFHEVILQVSTDLTYLSKYVGGEGLTSFSIGNAFLKHTHFGKASTFISAIPETEIASQPERAQCSIKY